MSKIAFNRVGYGSGRRLNAKSRIAFSVAAIGMGAMIGASDVCAQCVWQMTPPGPSARAGSRAVYDSDRELLVMFGGADMNNGFSNETWLYAGGGWAQHVGGSTVPGRSYQAMAYDKARGEVIMHGGSNGIGAALSDTRCFDGEDWTFITLSGPSARYRHAMAYHEGLQRTILYGGVTPTFQTLGDTWEWNGSTWTQRFPTNGPGPLNSHAMAYDIARQRVVLFGGRPQINGAPTNETWEYDGVNWTLKSSTGPAARFGANMAYDSGVGCVILYGGSTTTTLLNQIWEWNGASWSQRDCHPPVAIVDAAMAYDDSRNDLVIFGGLNPGFSDETWATGNAAPVITDQPDEALVAPGGTAIFSIQTNIPEDFLDYEWRKNGVPLNDDGRIVGSQTPMLTINDVGPGDVDNYYVRVTSAITTIQSLRAWLVIPQGPCLEVCPAGAVPEGEVDCYDGYADYYNGGPIFGGQYQPIECGMVVCGTGGNHQFGFSAPGDNDWWQIIVNEPTAFSWRVSSEFAALVVAPGVAPAFMTPCQTIELITPELPPGQYSFAIDTYPSGNAPCGSRYIVELTCLGNEVLGDLDGDGQLNEDDIAPLALALTDPQAFAIQYPAGNIENADLDGDGFVDGRDVQAFVAALTSP